MGDYKVELGLYHDCLYEIKRRIGVIADHLNKKTTERYLIIEVETICLQFRKILEKIMLMSLVANKEAYAEQNAKFAANLFVAIKPYTVTNISEDRLMKLFQTADEGDGYTEWTVPGEGTQGLSYDEYHVDDDALYAKIMETFYQEVK